MFRCFLWKRVFISLRCTYRVFRNGCNVLGYESAHQNEKKIRMDMACPQKRWFTLVFDILLWRFFYLKKGLILGFLIVTYDTSKGNFHTKLYVFSSGYFQNVGHKTTCLEHSLEVLKNSHDHTFLLALKLPTTVVKKLIPYLIELDL